MAKILAVDDDITVQIILQELLESEGHDVLLADDGEAALQKTQEFQPDLIICDWMMPKLDGLELCRRIKADPQLATIFLILITIREQVADRVQGLDSGADDFLSKPIEPSELQARVRSGLRLRQLNQQLSQALHHLKQTQSQLIQSEKMSSLGQMIAGIAHEINNPVTFIHGNLSHIEDYSQDLLDLVECYQQEYPNPSPHLQNKITHVNLDFLSQDFPKVLVSMKVGTERLRELVLSLRKFSRLDEAERKPVDLHEGIESALFLVQHRLSTSAGQPGIQIIKDYGDLPPFECFPGQLNQVFLHLINNAIDALEISQEKESASSKPMPTINVKTTRHNNYQVIICIIDNGIGISDSVKPRIFDPFFTTKPVGQGRGLGLSIAHQIVVKQHGGELECMSQPNVGTEMIIKLPFKKCLLNAD
ncbi:response regulator receiver domain protein [Coleofasciculus chthonoplastes PCC 7420]|uniref:histidine kinase n=1 Tax=Coleofasciculus chthonoplastes PCC 7420 TaxID=118168 RepID=B4VM90_9CYAN|nr:response regulator [Coleofasciculus chthonoplastes]EDX76994.1 response regulator receiver domain protein [Coleofasciculus chthonoplastes PCC 7420]